MRRLLVALVILALAAPASALEVWRGARVEVQKNTAPNPEPTASIEIVWRSDDGQVVKERYVPSGADVYPDGFIFTISAPAALRDGGTAELRACAPSGLCGDTRTVPVTYLGRCRPIASFFSSDSPYLVVGQEPGTLRMRAEVTCP